MKLIKHLLTLTMVLTLISGSTSLNAQTYQLDLKNSSFDWTGYGEIGGFSQEGTIKAQSGVITIVDSVISKAIITIDMESMQSDNKRVADHLKNEDFFYVKKYPTATLQLHSMVGFSVMQADLMIRGVTHAIDIPLSLDVSDKTVIAQGTATIDRTLYGIKYNSSSFFKRLGNQAIKNEFDLAFDLLFKVVK